MGALHYAIPPYSNLDDSVEKINELIEYGNWNFGKLQQLFRREIKDQILKNLFGDY